MVFLRVIGDSGFVVEKRAGERGLERRQAEPLPRLGLDEKAFRKGQKYFTLVNDLERSRVLYVAQDRTQTSLDGFWRTLSPEQAASIEAAAIEPKDRREFAELRKSELKTARAWALKEAAMALFSYVHERPARKHFRWWQGWAVRSRLQPRIETARRLKRRLENVLTYLRHRITNAASESINSKIQCVKHTARGFRNKKNFQIAIYFHCGGLDMAPSCH